MDNSIYLAMRAAEQMLTAQAAHSNNLANGSTTGFKAELQFFMDENIAGSGLQLADRSINQQSYADLSPGQVVSTGRSLDVAIQSDTGWFSFLTAEGNEAYSRAGGWQLSAQGLLTTAQGDSVLGENGPIVIPPYEHLDIANDGTISIRPAGSGSEELVVLDRLKLVAPQESNLERGKDGLFYTKDGANAAIDINVKVLQGSYESSNVNMVGEMISMMEMSRAFEMQMKMVESAKDNDKEVASLMKLA